LLTTPSGEPVRFFTGAPDNALGVADPHRTYVVGLDDLLQGRLLEAARPVAWRYLLIRGEEAIGEVELSRTSESEEFSAALHQGPFANAFLVALRAAERLPQVRKTQYELRYLKSAAVYLAALWLHGETSDLLIPLGPAPAKLAANKVYTESKMLSSLRATAQQAQRFSQRFK
jgi:hypothetical protein